MHLEQLPPNDLPPFTSVRVLLESVTSYARGLFTPISKLVSTLKDYLFFFSRYFDAFSTFDVGTDGLIHRHKLDKVHSPVMSFSLTFI